MLRSAFDERLDRQSRAPLAVAFSGGGDSLALLLMTKSWADAHGRRVIALTVDHGLQPLSAEWTCAAGQVAARLGVAFQALSWSGPKPVTGLPSAARAARHRLVADAARQAGAGVILLGHTLDDQFENALMRDQGERLGPLRDWSASPVWPEGRGLFHFRPLLAQRRADLRAWLAGQGLTWLDDPANNDPRHPRTRARAALAGGAVAAPTPDRAIEQASQWRASAWGGLTGPRDGASLRLIQIAAACACGREALGRPARAGAILERIQAGERFIATLGGARVIADRDLLLLREVGEFRREGSAEIALSPPNAQVWDGRFELTTQREGVRISPLTGKSRRLQPAEKTAFLAIPAAARGSLPLAEGEGLEPTCPILARPCADAAVVRVKGLVGPRFAAACGLITREATTSVIGCMADRPKASYVGAEPKGVPE